MSYQHHTIHFPIATLGNPAFVTEYLTRYTDPATGWAAAHQDQTDDPTRLRRASLFPTGETLPTIVPTPVYDPPLTPEELPSGPITREPVALAITCHWPEPFLADLTRDPQPEPELFDGVEIVS